MNTFFDTRIEALQGWLRGYRARRNLARTRLFLASLPQDIQKDIGWPDERVTLATLPAKQPKWDAEAFLAQTECSN